MLAAGKWVQDGPTAKEAARTAPLASLFRALQFESRFGGHTREPFSVLHHTLWGAEALRADGQAPEIVDTWLLHDLHEVITKDVPRHVKCACMKQIGDFFDEGVKGRTDLHTKELLPSAIKNLDQTIIAEEVFQFGLEGWGKLPESAEAPRPAVISAIKKVWRYASKGRTQAFGAKTQAPQRIAEWLTGSNQSRIKGFEWVLEGLQFTEIM